MVFCKNCGRELGPEDRFCPSCGTSPEGKKVCPHCGAKVVRDSVYCGSCGKPMEGSASASTTTVRVEGKSPAFAAILSLIWTGLGQVYAGATVKGLLMMFVLPIVVMTFGFGIMMLGNIILVGIGILLIIGYYIYAIVDAYNMAKRYPDI